MAVRQISIFVENVPGRLARITKCIAKANVNIRALCVADTADFGILRLIVSDTDLALKSLKDQGCTATVSEVLAVAMDDKPGSLNESAEILAENDISIEYLYAFLSPNAGKAFLIIRVDDNDKAHDVLKAAGITVVDNTEEL